MGQRCHYCLFHEDSKCQCYRCTNVRAMGWCNANHKDFFYEELEMAKRRELETEAHN